MKHEQHDVKTGRIGKNIQSVTFKNIFQGIPEHKPTRPMFDLFTQTVAYYYSKAIENLTDNLVRKIPNRSCCSHCVSIAGGGLIHIGKGICLDALSVHRVACHRQDISSEDIAIFNHHFMAEPMEFRVPSFMINYYENGKAIQSIIKEEIGNSNVIIKKIEPIKRMKPLEKRIVLPPPEKIKIMPPPKRRK